MKRGNRWPDVCALCDRAIDLERMPWTLHLYIGAGKVHGGGREHIPVHHVCAYLWSASDRLDELHPNWVESWRHITMPDAVDAAGRVEDGRHG